MSVIGEEPRAATCGVTLSCIGGLPDLLAAGTTLAPAVAQLVPRNGSDLVDLFGPLAEAYRTLPGFMSSLTELLIPYIAEDRGVRLSPGVHPATGLGGCEAAVIASLRLLVPDVVRWTDGALPPLLLNVTGGRPHVRPEFVAAAWSGAVCLRWRRHPAAALSLGAPPGLWGVVLPRDVHVLPRIPVPEPMSAMRATAAAGRLAVLTEALRRGEPPLLEAAGEDPLFLPAVAPHWPGAYPAVRAARDAGAWLAWFPAGGPALAVLAPPERLAHAMDAICTVWSAHGVAFDVLRDRAADSAGHSTAIMEEG
ncbi:MAG: hypothetical protein EA398_05970 [Deltaproteobacteria bacterium]|nr:MAG: hypothetical protein EA398_05970 [Deltaproteobacteria bacterium]